MKWAVCTGMKVVFRDGRDDQTYVIASFDGPIESPDSIFAWLRKKDGGLIGPFLVYRDLIPAR